MKKFFGVSLRGDEKRLSWKIGCYYAGIAGVWFLLSDNYLAVLLNEPQLVTLMHLLNDWLYVLFTAVLLGWLVRRQVRSLRREDELLRAMAQGISVATGEDFFSALTENLTRVLETEGAFIGEVSGSPPELRTVAARVRGRDAEALELDPEGMLLSRLRQEGSIRCTENARDALGGVPVVAELGAKSFLGIPLVGGDGKVLGMLAVASSEPLQKKAETAETILSVFAVRTVIELERRRAETQLWQEKDFLAGVLKELPAFLVVIDPEGRVVTASDRLLHEAGRGLEQVSGRDFLDALVPADERSTMKDCLEGLRSTAASVEFESRLLTGEGKSLPLAWHLRSRPDYVIGVGVLRS